MLPVTENLEVALRHMRSEEKGILYWIDAICINQGNLQETSQQVMRMDSIFREAERVLIWLGPAANCSDAAMELVDRMSHLGNIDSLIKQPQAIYDWLALSTLMRRAWFSRRWVIQEVAFAREALVACGTKRTRWSNFADAVALYGDKFDDISMLVGPEGTRQLISHVCRDVSAHGLVTVLNTVIRKSSNGRVMERLCTMETLVSITATFQVSNPRDSVYAVMTLAKDSYLLVDDPVDYRKTLPQICKNLIFHSLITSGSLDIICRPWAPVDSALPSWVPQVSHHAFGPDETGRYRRINADSLVGHPRRRVYNAARATQALGNFSNNGQGLTLTVVGFQFDVIKSVEKPALDGVVPFEWIELLSQISGGQDSPSREVPDLLWRTLVADRGPDGNPPPVWYHRACEHLIYENYSGKNTNWDTQELMERPVQREPSSALLAFLRRIQSVVWNRTLMITETGAVGLVHNKAKAGDLICILFGCSVPVILRQYKDGCQEFIGECFVNNTQGVMDGQAMDRMEDGKYETREFNLR